MMMSQTSGRVAGETTRRSRAVEGVLSTRGRPKDTVVLVQLIGN